jgi:HAD superfamily hydrolase (TIGR01484 family)
MLAQPKQPRPIEELPADVVNALVGVLTDVDGTLTTNGKLQPDAFSALWALRNAGLMVIPVTGGASSLGDVMCRQWPVDAAIAEGGAVAFFERNGRFHRVINEQAARADDRPRLLRIASQICKEVPGARLANDLSFRLYDVAIDYAEEKPHLSYETAVLIKEAFERHGATAMISSIHVNAWFGKFDKLSMARQLLRDVFAMDLEQARERWIYCGDAPNDQPAFGYFPHSVGMGNVRDFEGQLECWPAYITAGRSGAGFAELAAQVLRYRCEARSLEDMRR